MTQRKTKIGPEVDKLDKLRNEVSKLNKQLEEVRKAKTAQENKVMSLLEEQGLEMGAGTAITASIVEEEIGSLKDWEKFFQFARRQNAPELIQHRISQPAFREMLQHRKGKQIPGTELVTLKKLSVTARRK